MLWMKSTMSVKRTFRHYISATISYTYCDIWDWFDSRDRPESLSVRRSDQGIGQPARRVKSLGYLSPLSSVITILHMSKIYSISYTFMSLICSVRIILNDWPRMLKLCYPTMTPIILWLTSSGCIKSIPSRNFSSIYSKKSFLQFCCFIKIWKEVVKSGPKLF